MQQYLDKQREFFLSDKTRDLKFRIKQLDNLEQVLKSNEKALCEAIHKDFKKSEFDTIVTELILIYKEIGLARRKLRQWASPKPVTTNLVNFPATSYTIPEPLGVSLIIGAWNYPYLLSLVPLVGAIAAGCTAVLKPSELPVHSSKIMATILNDAFEPGYIKVVEGGVSETTALLKLEFDKIFFTGSTRVGRIVYKAAAEHLIPVTLELGGKSPAIVTADCNLEMTVKRLVWAKYLNAGQTCISPDYVLVEASIEQQFLQSCVKAIQQADYSVENGNYPQIINEENLLRLQQMIDPQKVFYGGKVNLKERTMEPTVLRNVSFSDTAMEEEIFGPVLPVITFDSIDKVIAHLKELPKPLACYVFSGNRKVRKKVLCELSFGGGGVNDAVMQITNPNLSFGGVGNSGIGAYHGEAGFRAFSHYKAIFEKPNWFELNLKYPPYSKKKLAWIRRIFKF